MDIVSKNGTMMLNVGPKSDGTIPEKERQLLLEIGNWLKINGEAIYGSNVWRISGEGSTKIQEGQFTDSIKKQYTSEDIRYTINGSNLYATVLRYPENGIVKLTALAKNENGKLSVFQGVIEDVDVLGFDEKPLYKRTDEALEIQTKSVNSSNPVIFKIKID